MPARFEFQVRELLGLPLAESPLKPYGCGQLSSTQVSAGSVSSFEVHPGCSRDPPSISSRAWRLQTPAGAVARAPRATLPPAVSWGGKCDRNGVRTRSVQEQQHGSTGGPDSSLKAQARWR